MKNFGIKLDDIITVEYTARLKGGKTVSSTNNEGPLTFKVGQFPLVSGINDAVIGMKIGESKKVSISPRKAFGVFDEDLVHFVPLEDLPEYIRVGQRILGKENPTLFNVLEVNSEKGHATLDGNHFLAGHTLEVNIKVVSTKGSLGTRRKEIERPYSIYGQSLKIAKAL